MTGTRPETSPEDDLQPRSFTGVLFHSFFVIPFLIAVFGVLLFTAVSLLTAEGKTAPDYLSDIRVGGLSKRWQSAFELSQLLARSDELKQDKDFADELEAVFRAARNDDPRVRQYLALAMARTGQERFAPVLIQALEEASAADKPAFIYALGLLGDPRAVDVLADQIEDGSPRIRSLAVAALGSLKEPAGRKILKKSLADPEANVQWGAALALARWGDDSGLAVLSQLLSDEYLSQFNNVDGLERVHLQLAVIEQAPRLRSADLDAAIARLAEQAREPKVKAAAMNYTLRTQGKDDDG